MRHKKGILYGVGVGPGDPELLTIKAVRVIGESDVIGIPARKADTCTSYQIALQAVPEMAQKRVIAMPVPMTMDKARLAESYDAGAEAIIELLEQGLNMAFLNLGDPSVYGSYLKFHERVRARGYQAQIISGVPSFCAAAAALEIPLGQEREAIHILPGFYRGDEVEAYEGTRVLMKSGGRLEEVKARLTELEKKGEIRAYAVSNCGMEQETICREISKLDENAGYFTTIIVKELSLNAENN
jgi:precorrin-2 C(20)-methyltransferase